ncbi:MAG TPA: hypothetical protein VGE99_11720 [Candidatus Dormibacteraeota bacterium]
MRPLTMQSLAVTAVATSRMHTSLFLGRGSGTVLIWSTSTRTPCKRRLSSRLPGAHLERGNGKPGSGA